MPLHQDQECALVSSAQGVNQPRVFGASRRQICRRSCQGSPTGS